jgi:hypothetical protein
MHDLWVDRQIDRKKARNHCTATNVPFLVKEERQINR